MTLSVAKFKSSRYLPKVNSGQLFMQKHCSCFRSHTQRKSWKSQLGRGLKKISAFPPALRKNPIYPAVLVLGSVTERNAYQYERKHILTFYVNRLLLIKLHGPEGQIAVAAAGYIINQIFGCSLKDALYLTGQTFLLPVPSKNL